MEPTRITLDARLRPGDATRLAETLAAARGRPLELDGAGVAQLATPCLQVLLAAARSWREDGLSLRLVAPSAEIGAVLAVLAIPAAALGIEGA